MKPRILIFSIAYEPWVGGAELAVRNITDRLLDYEFDLITCRFSRQAPVREKIGNISVYRVGFGGRIGRYLYPVFAYRLAKKLHQKIPYRLIWSIMAAYAGAAALLFLRRFANVKFLLTLQEGDSIAHIHQKVKGFRGEWQKIFQQADYIQAISQYLADWAVQEGAVCPVEVVPNGVDVNKFKIQNSKFKITNQKFKIITVSRLVYKNGIDILIRAAAELKAIIPDSKFDIQILGTGPEEKNLKKLSKKLGLEDRIEFLGHIEHDKIPEYLAKADIFVRPSRSEGLGSAFLEAMAAGLPVIGTAVGGITDFLIDEVTGLLCRQEDPKDLALKIKRLISDEPLQKRLSDNARKVIEGQYSWEKIAFRMNEIFSKLI